MDAMQTKPNPRAADALPTMFVRMSAVVRMTGLGRSTIYRLMAEDKFPSPVRLAKRGRVAPHRPRTVERRALHGVALMRSLPPAR